MNWMSLIGAIPFVVSGIQAIHGSAVNGADKKTLALQSLGLAEQVAGGTLTGQNLQYAAVASSLIDSFVNTFKQAGLFGFTPSAPAIVVAPVTGAAVNTATGK